MIEKYNIFYDCDISKIPDKVLRKISIGLWSLDRKIVKKRIEQSGNKMIIIVHSIYNKKGEYEPAAEIKIFKP